jgi:outer membrane protein assembly factor BamD
VYASLDKKKIYFSVHTRYFFRFFIPFLLLTQCSNDEEIRDEMPLPRLYELGIKYFEKTDYEKATEYFKAIERQYPYADETLKAQLIVGFSQYMNGTYILAGESFKDFIILHPHHKEVPYALYMTGLCFYYRTSFIERDQSMAKDAYQVFKELITRFPNTPYADDAKLKLQQMADHISADELHTARYYESQFLYHAALARLTRVSPESIHYPEALYRQIECYKGLGENEEAAKAQIILLHQYPDSIFAKKI